MPRISHTAQAAASPNPTAGIVLTLTAADTTNKESTPCTGRELIVAQNTGGAAYTVTITSAPDINGRLGTISAQSLAAGAVVAFGPFQNDGWRQTDGTIYYEASNPAVKFAVIRV